jgi:hypothetical protein
LNAYQEKYPKGSRVCVKDRAALEVFMRNWRYHHPLQNEQILFAGQTGEVKEVVFYHGGDVLYQINGIPGLWHEECLTAGPDRVEGKHANL